MSGGNQVTDQIKELLHIGVNAELSYLVTVNDESLLEAVRGPVENPVPPIMEEPG